MSEGSCLLLRARRPQPTIYVLVELDDFSNVEKEFRRLALLVVAAMVLQDLRRQDVEVASWWHLKLEFIRPLLVEVVRIRLRRATPAFSAPSGLHEESLVVVEA